MRSRPDPIRGRDAHQAESEAFFQSIENRLDNENLFYDQVGFLRQIGVR